MSFVTRNIDLSTRWLSLEIAVDRCLKQYPSLKSYFLSENETAARFQRLKIFFEDPMTEIYLLFFQSFLPTLTCTNKFLSKRRAADTYSSATTSFFGKKKCFPSL